jgi:hypothetical protein
MDRRLTTSGDLVAFRYFGETWPLQPPTAFYDWLYISALIENSNLAEQVLHFDAFTDIAFNPKKSQSCQARALAMFVALKGNRMLPENQLAKSDFLALITGNAEGMRGTVQPRFPEFGSV